MKKTIYQCRGNALFLILIAVALFAALSYAVTNSGRGGGGVDREQAEIEVAQLLQYFAALDTAIMRMKLVGGVSDEELSFANDVWRLEDGTTITMPAGHNPNCTSNACEVFHPEGGGMIPYLVPESMDAWYDNGSNGQNFARHGKVQLIGVTNLGTSFPDLAINYAYLQPIHCDILNKKFGVTDKNIDDMVREVDGVQTFAGDYNIAVSEPIGDEEPDFIDENTFAIRHLNGTCKIHHVLIVK